MTVISAGLLLWRPGEGGPELLLGRMGGPYFARRDVGAWTIPKGLVDAGEDTLAAARREFAEETGLAWEGPLAPLPLLKAGRKTLLIWLGRGDPDLAGFRSNLFELEWPPRSGQRRSFPELEQVAWLTRDDARRRIAAGQRPVLDHAEAAIRSPEPSR